MLACQNENFFLSPDQHYLNCAFMSPLMRSVELAGTEALRLKRDPSKITPSMFFEEVNQARHLFAQLINGNAENVALIPATSYGIATIAHNLSVASGDNIVLINGQFPSNVYTWQRLSSETGAAIRTVTGRDGEWTQRILEAINYRTTVVSIGTLHWANGASFDLAEISQRARDVGAYLILDGTQSIGALPFDLEKIKPDALVCAGYKWLLGPFGTAFLYVGESFIDGIPLEEGWLARDGSENFGNLTNYTDRYRPGAARFDRGQTNSFAQTAMMTQGLKQILDWQPQQIQIYCTELIKDFLPAVRESGYTVGNSCFSHLFGVNLPDHLDRIRLNDELARCQISVSVRDRAIRISPNVYNNRADIDALQDVFLSAAR